MRTRLPFSIHIPERSENLTENSNEKHTLVGGIRFCRHFEHDVHQRSALRNLCVTRLGRPVFFYE